MATSLTSSEISQIADIAGTTIGTVVGVADQPSTSQLQTDTDLILQAMLNEIIRLRQEREPLGP